MNEAAHLPPRAERLLLRVEDYELLAESGAFGDYGRTELIDGEIYGMSAQYARHAEVKLNIAIAMKERVRAIGSDLRVLSEISVRVADNSMPEPDVILTRYRGGRAVPADTVALVIEVSDTTLDRDLGRKGELYATAGIPEYWVIDLEGGRALLHEHPGLDGYQGQLNILLGATLKSATIDGLELMTDALFD